jgi:peptidoglycan/LPS O-acetylase OafA/YrhL
MRIKQLDALRAVAVLMVIACHATPLTWGGMGVDLFFVLSGFLVSGLLFRDYKKTGSIHIANFLTRRGFKIYPAYYLFVGVVATLFAVHGTGFSTRQICANLFFLQNYAIGTYPHLWSIAVEEHFYIALPITLWFMVKRNALSKLPMVCGAVGIICLLLRIITACYRSADCFTFTTPTHLRIDSLTFGVLLSYHSEFHPSVIGRIVRFRWLLLAASLLLITLCALVPNENPFTYTLGYSVRYLGFGGLLVFVLNCTSGRSWFMLGLAKIGLHSYTIYLVHVPMIHLVGTDPTGVAIAFVLSICVGMLFGKVVEIPFLKLRDRLFPRPDEHVAGCRIPSSGVLAFASVCSGL